MQRFPTILSNRTENGTEDELAEDLPAPVTEEFGHEIPVLDLSADGRIYDHLPVLECDETLSRLISGPNGSCSAIYLWRSEYSRSYVAVARTQPGHVPRHQNLSLRHRVSSLPAHVWPQRMDARVGQQPTQRQSAVPRRDSKAWRQLRGRGVLVSPRHGPRQRRTSSGAG